MLKNRPVMPRTVTAGQRTVGDMTRSLARAGYDTSKLDAHVIAAKAIASEHRKRKRAQLTDDSMDVDSSEHNDSEHDAMEVDEEVSAASKRAKNNSGGVVGRSKLPQSNRQIAGLKNAEVRVHASLPTVRLTRVCALVSKQARRSSCGTSVNASATTTLEQGKAIVLLQRKWSVAPRESRILLT
jgi:hypothetical protein